MRRFWRTKQKPDVKRNIVFVLVNGYLLLLTVALLTSPTTAYFTDSTVIEGNIAAGEFASEENEAKADKGDQETVQSETDQESESEQADQSDEAT